MLDVCDTIFARASGAGLGAITVLRLSGSGTRDVLQRMAGRLPAPRFASLRGLKHPRTQEVLDRALVLFFPGPASFTGEDAAELHLHGGLAVASGVMDGLLACGCRPAERGEFTRRAFLHGKLDLLQAEAIADLAAAETAAQRRQALQQADGALTRLYENWAHRVTRLLAHQEAAIEFELDEMPTRAAEDAQTEARTLVRDITLHLEDGGRGERLRTGISLVIVGAPNAGKSSLLNALTASDAAIVSPIPGTTRDVVECRMQLAGVPVMLADTAGLRETDDEIEREGVRRALRHAEKADVLIAVFEAGLEPDSATLRLVEARPDALLVITKCDVADVLHSAPTAVCLLTSARTGLGMAELKAALSESVERKAALSDAPSLTRARHRAALEAAKRHLEAAAGIGHSELVAEEFRAAELALGSLTGRGGVEAILDVVFNDFCIGK